MRRLFALLVALMLLPLPATAQEATPTTFPVFPDPSECQATPRTAAEIDAFAPRQQGTPSPETDARRLVLKGSTVPASAEEIAGITATAREFAACLSLNDGGKGLGLYTDNMIAELPITSDAIAYENPPLPDGKLVAVVNIITPRTFTDGRVGAIVLLDDPRAPSPVEPQFMVFVEQDGRWLIDDLPEYAAPAEDEALIPATEAAANRAAWGLIDPDPADCQIAPRDAAELAAMEGEPPIGPNAVRPERTPLPAWPESVPPDPDTVAGIEATVAELAACAAADEPLRSASLYTDDLIASPYFSVITGPRRSGPEAFAVYDILDFGDGRVGAVVGAQSADFATPVFPLFVIFELVGDRWLISELPSPYIADDPVSGGVEMVAEAAPTSTLAS